MHREEGAGLELRNDNLELARLKTRIFSIKLSIRGLLTWGALILLLSGPLSALTSLWWLILIFGVVLPLAVGLAGRVSGLPQAGAAQAAAASGEKELLAALERCGSLTPARAALETSLSVAEADRMLSELAAGGYLEVGVEDGRIIYSL
jgi:hypothetical protein